MTGAAQNNIYLQRINLVIDHITSNPADHLSLDALAKLAAFSPFHFHRIFKSVTGEAADQRVKAGDAAVVAAVRWDVSTGRTRRLRLAINPLPASRGHSKNSLASALANGIAHGRCKTPRSVKFWTAFRITL